MEWNPSASSMMGCCWFTFTFCGSVLTPNQTKPCQFNSHSQTKAPQRRATDRFECAVWVKSHYVIAPLHTPVGKYGGKNLIFEKSFNSAQKSSHFISALMSSFFFYLFNPFFFDMYQPPHTNFHQFQTSKNFPSAYLRQHHHHHHHLSTQTSAAANGIRSLSLLSALCFLYGSCCSEMLLCLQDALWKRWNLGERGHRKVKT